MVQDVNALLFAGAVTATANTTPIDIDGGGQFVVVDLQSSVTPTDSDETLAVKFQVSVDGGTDYLDLITFPTLVKATDKGSAGTWIAMAAYLPRPNANPAARGANTKLKARLGLTVAGTTPSYTIRATIGHLSSFPVGSVAGFTSGVAGRYGPLDAIKAWG